MINPFSKEAKDQRALELEIDDIRCIMSMLPGRSFVYRLLVFSSVFSPVSSKEALEICYNAGAKEYPMRLLGILLSHCADEYIKMIEENTSVKYNHENG